MEKVAQDDPFRQRKVYIPLYLRTQHKKAAARVFISAEQKYFLQGYIPIMLLLNYTREKAISRSNSITILDTWIFQLAFQKVLDIVG